MADIVVTGEDLLTYRQGTNIQLFRDQTERRYPEKYQKIEAQEPVAGSRMG